MTLRYEGPVKALEKYLPDFCWQTTFEILTMIEQINIDAEAPPDSVKMAVSRLVKEGLLLRREIEKRTVPKGKQMLARHEYIRNPNWKRGVGDI